MVDLFKQFELEYKARNLVRELLGEGYYYGHIVRSICALNAFCEKQKQINAVKLRTIFYLHDLVEDTNVITYEYICEEFTKEIADFVMEVTKDENGDFPRLHSLEGHIIKTVDRAANFTSDHVKPSKKQDYIKHMSGCFSTTQKGVKNASR
jgi:(p)ppGpp synthase/HD superfamily hydrolase